MVSIPLLYLQFHHLEICPTEWVLFLGLLVSELYVSETHSVYSVTCCFFSNFMFLRSMHVVVLCSFLLVCSFNYMNIPQFLFVCFTSVDGDCVVGCCFFLSVGTELQWPSLSNALYACLSFWHMSGSAVAWSLGTFRLLSDIQLFSKSVVPSSSCPTSSAAF